MPDSIPLHYTTEFGTSWRSRTQQEKPRLNDFVEEINFTGERKGATHITDVNSDNRWAHRKSYDLANLIDKDDDVNLGELELPTSSYVRDHARAFNRDCDDVAWAAALDPVVIGTNGDATLALPGTQIITEAGTTATAEGTVGNGLTLGKLIAMNEILEDAELEEDSPRVIVVTKRQLSDLLYSTQVRSSDYSIVKALVAGTVTSYMGFEFKKVARIPKVGNVRTCPVWIKGAILRTMGTRSNDISVRKDRSMSTQIYSAWHLGATRIYDEGVGAIECYEAP